MTTVKATLSEATLSALLHSECGSLTDIAIREQVGSMRAVPWLERRGLVTVRRKQCWIERDDDPRRMDLRECTVVRLVDAPQVTR